VCAFLGIVLVSSPGLLPQLTSNLLCVSFWVLGQKKGEGSMSKSNHTEAQMIGALKQLEAGRKAEEVAREIGVSKHII